jgi:4a-hydroxytetrahydrobiopterin dehydratase
MSSNTMEQLSEKKCSACKGHIAKFTPKQVEEHIQALDGWRITGNGLRIRKDWQVKDFTAGMDFFNRVAQLAQEQDHHPDLHLDDYRHAWIEIWTHAIGGLSENDFILAAKIDHLPVELKK